jgi:hypothetical protein
VPPIGSRVSGTAAPGGAGPTPVGSSRNAAAPDSQQVVASGTCAPPQPPDGPPLLSGPQPSVTPHVSKPHDYVNHMFMRL